MANLPGCIVTVYQRKADSGLCTIDVRCGDALVETYEVRTRQIYAHRARLLERLSEEYPEVIGEPLPPMVAAYPQLRSGCGGKRINPRSRADNQTTGATKQ